MSASVNCSARASTPRICCSAQTEPDAGYEMSERLGLLAGVMKAALILVRPHSRQVMRTVPCVVADGSILIGGDANALQLRHPSVSRAGESRAFIARSRHADFHIGFPAICRVCSRYCEDL